MALNPADHRINNSLPARQPLLPWAGLFIVIAAAAAGMGARRGPNNRVRAQAKDCRAKQVVRKGFSSLAGEDTIQDQRPAAHGGGR